MTNDDEVENWRLSSFLLALPDLKKKLHKKSFLNQILILLVRIKIVQKINGWIWLLISRVGWGNWLYNCRVLPIKINRIILQGRGLFLQDCHLKALRQSIIHTPTICTQREELCILLSPPHLRFVSIEVQTCSAPQNDCLNLSITTTSYSFEYKDSLLRNNWWQWYTSTTPYDFAQISQSGPIA